MADAATSSQLKEAFTAHLEETQGHVSILGPEGIYFLRRVTERLHGYYSNSILFWLSRIDEVDL
jgi:hypothetical protein